MLQATAYIDEPQSQKMNWICDKPAGWLYHHKFVDNLLTFISCCHRPLLGGKTRCLSPSMSGEQRWLFLLTAYAMSMATIMQPYTYVCVCKQANRSLVFASQREIKLKPKTHIRASSTKLQLRATPCRGSVDLSEAEDNQWPRMIPVLLEWRI